MSCQHFPKGIRTTQSSENTVDDTNMMPDEVLIAAVKDFFVSRRCIFGKRKIGIFQRDISTSKIKSAMVADFERGIPTKRFRRCGHAEKRGRRMSLTIGK